MNLQSPTTLLSSIQFMKSKLRSDKQTLMDIKNDFTKFNKKSNPYIVPEEEEFVLDDITHVENNKLARHSKSRDKTPKKRMIEVKKEHEREIAKLKEEHQRQLNEVLRVKQRQMEDLQNRWRAKLEEQTNYISILEDQANSPIQNQIERVPREQYDTVINKLLQDNTRLHEENQLLRQQSEKWRKLYNQVDTQRTVKSRFKFSKLKKEQSHSNYESQKSGITRNRAHSVCLFTDENINSSNFSSDKQWEDIQIKDDEGRPRTIRQFSKQVLEERCSRAKEGYQSVKL